MGDPGERGTSGEKGRPVCIANDVSLLFDFDLHQCTNITNTSKCVILNFNGCFLSELVKTRVSKDPWAELAQSDRR